MKSLNCFRNIIRGSGLVTVLFIVFALALLFAIAGAAGTASAATGTCPSSIKNFKTDNNVAATFSTSGLITTYTFFSSNENPVGGLPGLVDYCVYYSGKVAPTISVQAKGANGATWISRQDLKDFAFVRPNGDKSNIPLDGTTTVMGTATWTTVPTTQTILLHINDPTVCAQIYGGTASTCYVFPGTVLLEESCVIGDGVDTAAYNAIPFGSVNCGPPSVGVEAYNFNELGDQVVLAGTARKLVSLTVQFQSFGCSVSGHWYSGTTDPCVTNPGDTFDLDITANIYASSSCSGTPVVCSGTPLATVTVDQIDIPFRPSADNVKCTGTDAGKWFNSLGNGGAGACVNSIGKLLTFDFSSQNITLPANGEVVWTVAYNSSHSGYSPFGESLACNSTDQGCPYDSLNIGTMSYTGAPYAGTDVDFATIFLNWNVGGYPTSGGTPILPAGVESTNDTIIPPDWTPYRPLGEIITQ